MNPQDIEYFKRFATDAAIEGLNLSDHYLRIQTDASGASRPSETEYLPGFDKVRRFLKPEHSYLVVGCGAGVEIAWLKNNGCKKITGLDISDILLAECKERYGVETVKADMRATGLSSAAYDTVITCRSLHHMFYPYEALEEICRLASKSVWIVSEPIKSLIKEIPRKIMAKRVISGANIYEYQFADDDLKRYMAFNGMTPVLFDRYWESSQHRANACKRLNSFIPFLGNRFAAVFQRY